jgi:tetratricopeptide (TPR) repeat protein
LNTAKCEIDVDTFRRLAADAVAARQAGDDARAVALFDAGLRLWRVRSPLADVPSLAYHPRVLALAAERVVALGGFGEALLATGAADRAVAVLEEARRAHPLDEAAAARLITAYDAAGKRALAVSTYHDIRRALADQLGIDPGTRLQAAYRMVLTSDGPHNAVPVGANRHRRVPATLPGDVTAFVGRQWELAELDRLLTTDDTDGTAVPIVVISGTAGVGKTALAVRWSHLASGRFPDGQLYVDLHGYGPQQPISGGDAVVRLLSALGLHGAEIPADLTDQIARFRTEVSHRRILVVLDNASSADQVRPLLPGTASSAVLVTSRDTLGEIVTRNGARRLRLDPLGEDEAVDLLRRLIGDRVDIDPSVGPGLAARCVGLPLALRVAAELAATLPDTPLPQLVADLTDRQHRLGMLDTGGSSVSVVFSWSYQHLAPDAARMFRLTGLHHSPHLDVRAAAALARCDVGAARSALTALTRAHLVHTVGPDRYAMHDLLRAYATELFRDEVPADEQAAARTRLVRYYLHAAHAAAAVLDIRRDPLVMPAPDPDIPPTTFDDPQSALAWFTTEHAVLMSVFEFAPDVHVPALATAMATYLEQRGHWPDWVRTQRAALDANQRLGDRHGVATAHRELGRALARLGSYREADAFLRKAVHQFEELDDQLGQAHAYNNRILVFERRGDYHGALHQAMQALSRYRSAANVVGEARALNNVAWCHTGLGRHAEAIICCRTALDLQQKIGDRAGESATWDTIGLAHHRIGRHEDAIRCYQQACEIHRETGDRFNEASTLCRLGDTAHASGDLATARDAWHDARNIFDELQQSVGRQLDTKLRSLPVA